jgi:hypothetical protein
MAESKFRQLPFFATQTLALLRLEALATLSRYESAFGSNLCIWLQMFCELSETFTSGNSPLRQVSTLNNFVSPGRGERSRGANKTRKNVLRGA